MKFSLEKIKAVFTNPCSLTSLGRDVREDSSIRSSLVKINKFLLLVAIVSLIYRSSSFSVSFIPNPFEIIFAIVLLSTIFYLLKNKKINEFFFAVPKKVLIATSCLFFSVLLGWFIAIFIKGIPPNFNNIVEFGLIVISLGIFFLVSFYIKNDEVCAKKYFYALLLPVIYIILILFPTAAEHFGLIINGSFSGLTTNPNIIYKILLIPTIFFITFTLFESKNIYLRILYFFVASSLVSLLFWTGERGALICLILGSIFVCVLFLLNNFNWEKLFYSTLFILAIFLVGFFLPPHTGKEYIMNRIFNPNNPDSIHFVIKQNLITGAVKKFVDFKTSPTPIINTTSTITTNIINVVADDNPPQTRIYIWPIYLKQVLMNPFGFGPNTHMSIAYKIGGYIGMGPHCSYIQILLWGGILGLLSFLYLLFYAFRNLKNKLKQNFNYMTVALAGILFTLSISLVFNDSLSLFCFWIILALSIKE